MATLNDSESHNVVVNSSKETISIQTSETSIPAINYGNISDYRSMNSNGVTGIAIQLQSSHENSLGNAIITETYLYGNKIAISLPSEIEASVTGRLGLIDTEITSSPINL